MPGNFFFILLLFVYLNIQNLFSQDIPSDFLINYIYKLKLDAGKGWSINRLGSITWQNINLNENEIDSIQFKYRIGSRVFIAHESLYNNPYFYGRATFFKNFYTYMYVRALTNYSDNNFTGYSGKKLDRKRFGLVSAENDLAGLGFENNWLKLQYGRGRELLTINTKTSLIMSEDSPSYDYGLIGFRYKNLQTRYFHGFLENHEDINRYINGRVINYNNGTNLNFSLSEIIIYSGQNRPIDLSYLNPIASHLEIEYNDRQNIPNTGSGNAVWLISSDYLNNSFYRLSINLLIDEFIIDSEQYDTGKKNGLGYSFRLSKAWDRDNFMLGLNVHYLNIGSKVFRHEDGYNNFVARGKPLGWKFGSDGMEFGSSAYYLIYDSFLAEIEYGKRLIGSESIIINPYDRYDDYNSSNSVSDILNEINFVEVNIRYWLNKNYIFKANLEIISDYDNEGKVNFKIGLDAFLSN